jgi:hypothetical protein
MFRKIISLYCKNHKKDIKAVSGSYRIFRLKARNIDKYLPRFKELTFDDRQKLLLQPDGRFAPSSAQTAFNALSLCVLESDQIKFVKSQPHLFGWDC